MVILQITPEAPGTSSGGKLGVLQTLLELRGIGCIVDYVGPKIDDVSIRTLYRRIYELDPETGKFKLVLAMLHGVLNRRYYAWKHLALDCSGYDVVWVDFTKLDYVVKDVKKRNPRLPVIVRVHNIEADYAYDDWKLSGGWKKWLIAMFATRQEQAVSRLANELIPLTAKDRDRLVLKYRVPPEKIQIIPVCVQDPVPYQTLLPHEGVSILITGSLWFGANLAGIEWFLQSVLPKLDDGCSVTIAGFHPAESLKKKCHDAGVLLVDSPEDLKPYYEACDIVAVPVFDGAGMKVKVAEALSYGKPVVATSFGAIGYAIENGFDGFIADTPASFADAINQYRKASSQRRDTFSHRARALYERQYSIACCSTLCISVLNHVKERMLCPQSSL